MSIIKSAVVFGWSVYVIVDSHLLNCSFAQWKILDLLAD